MPDYSSEVASLAANPDKIWQSANPANFQRNGKINFLLLNEDWTFTLTVIKPGNMKSLQVKIESADSARVRDGLKDMQDWDKTGSDEKWRTPSWVWVTWDVGDQPGNTYRGNRTLALANGQKLEWRVFHKNMGSTVQIDDQFHLLEK